MLEPLSVYFEHCEPGWHVPESETRNHILLLVTSGSLIYHIGRNKVQLQKGEMLFIPQGVMRSADSLGAKGHEMYAVHFLYEGDGDGIPVLQKPEMRHVKLFQFDYMKQRFSLLTQHWLRKHAYAATILHSILLEMLAIFNEEADTVATPNRAYSIVSQLQNYIAMNYRRPIPMSELAELVQRTPNYISRLFKETTGQTITEYIRQIRITAACDLLANSSMTVGEVSDFLGFCEQSYFNKVFKKITGTLPSAYMKEKMKVWK